MNDPKIQNTNEIKKADVAAPTALAPTPNTCMSPATTAINGNPDGTKTEQLVYFENIITLSLDHEDRLAEAITQIKVRELYKLTNLSFREFVKARWELSKSRAYQLLKYARQKERAQANGNTPPVNERAARHLDANGNPPPPDNNYSKYLVRAKRDLHEIYAKVPPTEARQYLIEIQAVVSELLTNLGVLHPKIISSPIIQHSQPVGNIPAKDISTASPIPCSQPKKITTSNTPSPTPIFKEGGHPNIQRPLAATAASFPEPAGATLPPVGPDTAQPQPTSASYGGVTPMTMAEAKSKGLIK